MDPFRIAKIIFAALLCLQNIGCAYKETVDATAAQKADQETKFLRLQIGQEKSIVLDTLGYSILHRLGILDDHTTLELYTIYNEETRKSFGIVFEENHLVSVLDSSATNTYRHCISANVGSSEEFSSDVKIYKNWASRHNILNNKSELAGSEAARQTTAGGEAFDTTLSALVYSPFIAMAAPAIVANSLSGKTSQDDEKRKRMTQAEEASRVNAIDYYNSLKIGQSYENTLPTGPLHHVGDRGRAKYFQNMPSPYVSDRYAVGLAFINGELALKELPAFSNWEIVRGAAEKPGDRSKMVACAINNSDPN